jgi:hypothetical protein
MNESIKRFFDAAEKDESLKAGLRDAIKADALEAKASEASAGNGKPDVVGVLVKFAKSAGYDFTVGDLGDYWSETFGGSGELTDEQLEAVAGGEVLETQLQMMLLEEMMSQYRQQQEVQWKSLEECTQQEKLVMIQEYMERMNERYNAQQ